MYVFTEYTDNVNRRATGVFADYIFLLAELIYRISGTFPFLICISCHIDLRAFSNYMGTLPSDFVRCTL